MRRSFFATIAATVLSLTAAVELAADSKPTLSGGVAGIELCPQSICGAAIFVGGFEGELNSRDASGGFAAAINHEPLPAPLEIAAITGGQWTITARRRILVGDVTGGTILNLDGTRFCVQMEMEITEGGRGQVYFVGLLDHNPFPPTIAGLVTQAPVSCAAFLASAGQ